jgi:hypothetical protein
MSNIKKNGLIFILFFVCLIQIYHTVFDKMTWPFSPHNFYCHRSSLVKPVFRIGLIDDLGEVTLVDCRYTLPIEGYRCGSIYREVFLEGKDVTHQQKFAQLILARLNQGGWQAFDERFSPALPQPGRKYVGLNVERHYLDMLSHQKAQPLHVIKIEPVYTYSTEES